MHPVLLAVCGLIVALVALVASMAAGLRRRSPAAMRMIRRFNRAVVNPRMLKRAGKPGAYASVITHRGRTSGRTYRTPVAAEPTDDGFVIALVYGERSDWVRNVLASGSATLTREGAACAVDRPELLPLSAMIECFPAKDRRSLERFNVDRCLRVRRVGGG